MHTVVVIIKEEMSVPNISCSQMYLNHVYSCLFVGQIHVGNLANTNAIFSLVICILFKWLRALSACTNIVEKATGPRFMSNLNPEAKPVEATVWFRIS